MNKKHLNYQDRLMSAERMLYDGEAQPAVDELNNIINETRQNLFPFIRANFDLALFYLDIIIDSRLKRTAFQKYLLLISEHLNSLRMIDIQIIQDFQDELFSIKETLFEYFLQINVKLENRKTNKDLFFETAKLLFETIIKNFDNPSAVKKFIATEMEDEAESLMNLFELYSNKFDSGINFFKVYQQSQDLESLELSRYFLEAKLKEVSTIVRAAELDEVKQILDYLIFIMTRLGNDYRQTIDYCNFLLAISGDDPDTQAMAFYYLTEAELSFEQGSLTRAVNYFTEAGDHIFEDETLNLTKHTLLRRLEIELMKQNNWELYLKLVDFRDPEYRIFLLQNPKDYFGSVQLPAHILKDLEQLATAETIPQQVLATEQLYETISQPEELTYSIKKQLKNIFFILAKYEKLSVEAKMNLLRILYDFFELDESMEDIYDLTDDMLESDLNGHPIYHNLLSCSIKAAEDDPLLALENVITIIKHVSASDNHSLYSYPKMITNVSQLAALFGDLEGIEGTVEDLANVVVMINELYAFLDDPINQNVINDQPEVLNNIEQLKYYLAKIAFSLLIKVLPVLSNDHVFYYFENKAFIDRYLEEIREQTQDNLHFQNNITLQIEQLAEFIKDIYRYDYGNTAGIMSLIYILIEVIDSKHIDHSQENIEFILTALQQNLPKDFWAELPEYQSIYNHLTSLTE